MHFLNKSLVFSTGIQFYFSYKHNKAGNSCFYGRFVFVNFFDDRFSSKQILLRNRNVLKFLFFSVKTGPVFLLHEKPQRGNEQLVCLNI